MNLPLRLHLDEDVPYLAARIAREHGLDVTSTREAGRERLIDEEQLRRAAAEGRCLVTRNRKDFERLTVRFFEQQRAHSGVLIVARSLHHASAAMIASALVAFAQEHPDGIPSYAILFLRPAPPSR